MIHPTHTPGEHIYHDSFSPGMTYSHYTIKKIKKKKYGAETQRRMSPGYSPALFVVLHFKVFLFFRSNAKDRVVPL